MNRLGMELIGCTDLWWWLIRGRELCGMSPQVVNLCRTDVREGAASLLLLPLTALASSNKKRITRSRKGRAKMGVLIITLVLLLYRDEI